MSKIRPLLRAVLIATSHTANTHCEKPLTQDPNRWWPGISTAKAFAADCVSALLTRGARASHARQPLLSPQHSTGNQYHFLLPAPWQPQQNFAEASSRWWRGRAIVRAAHLHIPHPSLAASPIPINLQLSGPLPAPPLPLSCARPLQHRRLRSARHASLISPSRVINLGQFLANCLCPDLKPPILHHKPQTINY